MLSLLVRSEAVMQLASMVVVGPLQPNYSINKKAKVVPED